MVDIQHVGIVGAGQMGSGIAQLKEMVSAGRLGRKIGRAFYNCE